MLPFERCGRVFQQGFDGREDGLVAGGERTEMAFWRTLGADGSGDRESRVSSALTLAFEEAERGREFLSGRRQDFAG